MPRESNERPQTTLRPPDASALSPAPTGPFRVTGEVRVRAGRESLTVRWSGAGELVIELDDRVRVRGQIAAEAVTLWCRQASLLLDATLAVGAGDSVEVRTPPLVTEGGCMALRRTSTQANPAFGLVFAATPEALSADIMPEQVPVARDEAKQLVAALTDAVSATPRDA